MYKHGLIFIVVLLFTVSCEDNNPENGKIFTVTKSEGTGLGTLHDAIRNANMETEPCKIVFNKVSSIILKEELPEISCAVTIDGGKDGVTIDAEGKRRIFMIVRNEITTEVSFSNLTLTGGYSDDAGGAIDCSFEFCSISINDCIFKNNKSEERGGAIYSRSFVNIDNCVFNGNESNWGGAIYGVSSIRIQLSIFEKNKALNGGAIVGEYPSGIYITDCVFSNNEAYEDGEYGAIGKGGAIFAQYLHVFNSLFVKNKANGRGGAFHLASPSGGLPCICINSTFVENSTTGRGGAICTGTDYPPRPTFAHTLFFAYCTFFGNSSGGMGGAVFGSGECFYINNIFSGNKVSDESTDNYGNALTGNQTKPETTSDFFAGYPYMVYNIYDRFYYDEGTDYPGIVTGNVRATVFDVFGTDQPQLKNNIIPILPNGPANGLGRPVSIVLGDPFSSFSYRDGEKWWRLYDGNEYAGNKNDTIIVSDQTGFQRPENNITVGAWQVR